MNFDAEIERCPTCRRTGCYGACQSELCVECGEPAALRRVLFDGHYVETLCGACWLATLRELAGRR